MRYRYYFLASALPVLKFSDKPEMSYIDLIGLIKDELHIDDLKIVKEYQTYIDLKNIKELWLKCPVDPRGSLDEKNLHEALMVKDHLPTYVFDYMEKYPEKVDRLKNFSYILVNFFESINIFSKNSFLKWYFDLERKILIISTALRAEMLNRNIEDEFKHEDKTHPLVKRFIEEKGPSNVELGLVGNQIKAIFLKHYQKPTELREQLLQFRFDLIETHANDLAFVIDQILGYLVQLKQVEDSQYLDKNAGKLILDTILR